MTAPATVSDVLFAADADALPCPATTLPRPVSVQLDTADSGRISFGAGFRLPAKQ